MRGILVLLALAFWGAGNASPLRDAQHVLQAPLWEKTAVHRVATRKLHGRFLHITGALFTLTIPIQALLTDSADLHPDPFYKVYSSTEEGISCHRGTGPAGTYGAETSDCDSPFALINETFKWIENNLRDTVDFVVWTGDSARHDSDEELPRSTEQVVNLNRYIAGKFAEVFGNGKDEKDPTHDMLIPVVPTFGNNDILPHNILMAGPNRWLREYTDVWRKFIPEEQRHSFQRGGWFWVEVIPQKLAVFSLNTLYFFDHNTAVDGCALKSEPGFEHMEWLRIQLQFMRQRGMKAILTGHVPPARTESKQLWDESCWQKYTLWLKQYRDVVVSGIYGHMNIDHFLIQDTKDIDLLLMTGLKPENSSRIHLEDELTINSAADYLEELRNDWSKLPNPSVAISAQRGSDGEDLIEPEKKKKKKKGKKSKKDKALKKIGGPWGERFQLSTIAPSVVPNFFPTLRVIEYNVTGLEGHPVWSSLTQTTDNLLKADWAGKETAGTASDCHDFDDLFDEDSDASISKKKKKKKKPKDPNLTIPPPPSKSSPPGPAYSPQTLTLLGYIQYFANLTYINNDLIHSPEPSDTIDNNGWHEGKHKDKKPNDGKPHPKEFTYEVEYSTFNDSEFKLQDMTVRSYLKLAHRIGKYKPPKGDQIEWEDDDDNMNYEKGSLKDFQEMKCFSYVSHLIGELTNIFEHYADVINAWLAGQPLVEYHRSHSMEEDDEEPPKKRKGHQTGHKKKHGHKTKNKNKAWLAFIKRAFVGILDDEEMHDFQVSRDTASLRALEDDI
jgi:endopolyphosphatase